MGLKGILIIIGIVALISLVIVGMFVAKAPEMKESEDNNLIPSDI